MALLHRKVIERVAASASLGFAGLRSLRSPTLADPALDRVASLGTSDGREGEVGPDPTLEKPGPITMAELARRTIRGAAAAEVSDFAPGGYKGELSLSPPHAHMNPA